MILVAAVVAVMNVAGRRKSVARAKKPNNTTAAYAPVSYEKIRPGPK